MPNYQYKCDECLIEVEEIKKIEDRDIINHEHCPKKDKECECKMTRVIAKVSPPVFNGSGFYSTDYK